MRNKMKIVLAVTRKLIKEAFLYKKKKKKINEYEN